MQMCADANFYRWKWDVFAIFNKNRNTNKSTRANDERQLDIHWSTSALCQAPIRLKVWKKIDTISKLSIIENVDKQTPNDAIAGE